MGLKEKRLKRMKNQVIGECVITTSTFELECNWRRVLLFHHCETKKNILESRLAFLEKSSEEVYECVLDMGVYAPRNSKYCFVEFTHGGCVLISDLNYGEVHLSVPFSRFKSEKDVKRAYELLDRYVFNKERYLLLLMCLTDYPMDILGKVDEYLRIPYDYGFDVDEL